MDQITLSDEPDVRSSTRRRSNGARDPGAGEPRGRAARPEWGYADQGTPVSARAIDPSPADANSTAALAETADYLQADYFLQLLTQNRRLSDRRIEQYRKAIAASEANGDIEGAYGLRCRAHIEEEDRATLDGLIENLHRRFPRREPAKAPANPPRAGLAVR